MRIEAQSSKQAPQRIIDPANIGPARRAWPLGLEEHGGELFAASGSGDDRDVSYLQRHPIKGEADTLAR